MDLNDKVTFLKHFVLFAPSSCFFLGCDLPYWAISHQLWCWRKHLYLVINHQREREAPCFKVSFLFILFFLLCCSSSLFIYIVSTDLPLLFSFHHNSRFLVFKYFSFFFNKNKCFEYDAISNAFRKLNLSTSAFVRLYFTTWSGVICFWGNIYSLQNNRNIESFSHVFPPVLF